MILASEGRKLRVAGTEEADDWRTGQAEHWAERNPKTAAELEERWLTNWQRGRREVVTETLVGVPRTASILEVGCGPGAQLDLLCTLGFTNLTGVDIGHAVLTGVPACVAQADAAWLPFADDSFDLVFTCGTLMHIPPGYQRQRAVTELVRVSHRWVWITEYRTERPHIYRFDAGLMPALWTEDWAVLFGALAPGLRSVSRRILARLNAETVLAEYFMEKPR